MPRRAPDVFRAGRIAEHGRKHRKEIDPPMKKSLYSLTLMDSVVAEIDRLAARQGTNRSNLVNQILADYERRADERREEETAWRINARMVAGDQFITALPGGMIADSAKKLFDVVLVWKLDRFARNAMILLSTATLCAKTACGLSPLKRISPTAPKA